MLLGGKPVVVGGLVVGLLLSLNPALAVDVEVNFTGKVLEPVFVSSTEINFSVPSEASISQQTLELVPVYNVSGTPYIYRRKLMIYEGAGVPRTNELLEVSLDLGKIRSDCKDVILVGQEQISYQRTSCSQGKVGIRATVPSVAGPNPLEWWVYYGNLDDSLEKSTIISGIYTTTHTNQYIGGCSSKSNHCSVAHIGSSTCNGPLNYNPGYAVYVTGQRCGGSRECGTGCSGSCSISGWSGDSGNTISGQTSGTTSCSTAILGGFNHRFYLDWSQLLTYSIGTEETPEISYFLLLDGTPLSSGSLKQSKNITLPINQGDHSLTINSFGLIFINPYIKIFQSQNITLNQTFTQDKVQYYFLLDPNMENFQARFITPMVNDRKSNQNFTFNQGEWTTEYGHDPILINFTTTKHNITLNSVLSPELEFKPSGVPVAENTRACFDGVCYLEYGNELREVNSIGGINLDDRLLINLTINHSAECSAGETSNQTSGGHCLLSLDRPETTIRTFNSTNWSAGLMKLNLTLRSLDIGLEMPSSSHLGQEISFSGFVKDNSTNQGVNGTILVLIHTDSTQAYSITNITQGNFQGNILPPSAATYLVRTIALDPPGEEFIWGVCSETLTIYSPNEQKFSTTSYPRRGGRSVGGGGITFPDYSSPSPTNYTDPNLQEFFEKLSQAEKFGSTPWLRDISEKAQQLMINQQYGEIDNLTQELYIYIQQKADEEWSRFRELNSSLFIYSEESNELHLIFLNFLNNEIDLTELRNFELNLENSVKSRKLNLINKLGDLGHNIPENNQDLIFLVHQLVLEKGTSKSLELYYQRRYIQALDYLENNTPEQDETTVIPPETPPPEIPIILLFSLPLLILPASIIRHVNYWK
jgi:hypothetical protein